LEQEGQLFLLGAFADQAQQPSGQTADHQEHLEARRGSAPGFAQALTELRILGIPKRFFNGHPLAIERDDGGRTHTKLPSLCR
jgi:hypothetical protein